LDPFVSIKSPVTKYCGFIKAIPLNPRKPVCQERGTYLAFQPPKFVSGEKNLRMLIQSLLGMLLPQKFVTKLKATLDEGPMK
jgi:hypothetical protein